MALRLAFYVRVSLFKYTAVRTFFIFIFIHKRLSGLGTVAVNCDLLNSFFLNICHTLIIPLTFLSKKDKKIEKKSPLFTSSVCLCAGVIVFGDGKCICLALYCATLFSFLLK